MENEDIKKTIDDLADLAKDTVDTSILYIIL